MKIYKKGEIFVAIGIVISLLLILISMEGNYVQNIEKKDLKVGREAFNTFSNLKEEYKKTGRIGISLNSNFEEKISSFSAFLEKKLGKQGLLLFFSTTRYKNGNLNVSLGNFLNENLENITIKENITNQTKTLNTLELGKTKSVSFNISDSSKSYKINTTFSGKSSGETKIEVFSGKRNKITIFYDLSLTLEGSKIGEKFQIEENLT